MNRIPRYALMTLLLGAAALALPSLELLARGGGGGGGGGRGGGGSGGGRASGGSGGGRTGGARGGTRGGTRGGGARSQGAGNRRNASDPTPGANRNPLDYLVKVQRDEADHQRFDFIFDQRDDDLVVGRDDQREEDVRKERERSAADVRKQQSANGVQ